MMESQKLIFGLWYRKGKLTDISVRFAKVVTFGATELLLVFGL